MRKAAIVLPTYNEAGSVEQVVNEIFAQEKKNPNWEIHAVVVDSESPDGTDQKVRRLMKKFPRLHLLSTKKEGLGKAYIHGFHYVLDKLNPYLILEMDGDMQHDPREISNFIRKIEKGADFVIGARYIKGGSIPKDWKWHRKLFSILGNAIVRFGFMKLKIHDWTGGYRAIKAWVVKGALQHVKSYSGYVFQIAILDNAIKSKAVINEIPIQFNTRRTGKSKINSLQYIISIFLYIFLHSSFIKYALVGGIGFVIDFAISYLLIERSHFILWKATLISTETAIISNFILNNFWSFSHKRLEHNLKSYIPNFLKFNLISSGAVIIQTVGVQLLANIFGRKLWYVYKVILIIFIIIPYSYILYNKFIWKEK